MTPTDGRARAGLLDTPHGLVETPASCRSAPAARSRRDATATSRRSGASDHPRQHLSPLSPARRRPHRRRGGLHRFIGWTARSSPTAAATRSSASATAVAITEEGARFQSHLDGSAHLLTPERAVDIQAQLGSDIAMVLDECPPYPGDTERGAPRRSSARRAGPARDATRFLQRSLRRRRIDSRTVPNRRPGPVRDRPGRHLSGPARAERRGDARHRLRGLRHRRPQRRRAGRDDVRHRGSHGAVPAGGPAALPDGHRHARSTWSSASRGASTCSTACCRPATPATASSSPADGVLNIRNARFAEDDRPLDDGVRLLHLPAPFPGLSAASGDGREMLGATLNTIHNLVFYLDTMRADQGGYRVRVVREVQTGFPSGVLPRLPDFMT